jgi:type VI secretion system protein ImpB
MSQSTQHILDRVRPPRVQITYDVEVGNAIEMKELPFVVGVIADLSGDRDPDNPLDPMKARKFIEIDRDNFNEIMTKLKPRLAFQVDNTLANDNTQLNVLVNFRSMDDFNPVNIIQQIPAMATLYETRSRLKDLLSKLDGNDDLDALLSGILSNTDAQSKMKTELNLDAPAAPSASGATAAPSAAADAAPKASTPPAPDAGKPAPKK